ncbi:hypothetical protein [Paraburkholderia sp. BL10I2N1]|uniref:hypothetical protein n=1 Tax=Paraburkholderia sp. BL10I2N1 TaxID=1938796 RepID=UPI00105E2E40|nr:hypothetical protein [Paraburkholderia sp. BL10I2N1]TDN61469.1 hypothetical protein B0G77_4933 [Paraburkholderia sp. BL10I2N1]
MSHELYIQVLSAMFLFWNGARVLTYLPTISKLLEREVDVRSYSLLSWGSWALSNGTFALMLLEMSRGVTNPMFWMNLANTLMCAVVTFIIVLRRSRRLHPWVNGLYRTISRSDSTRLAISTEAGLPDLGVRPGGDARIEAGYIPLAQRGRFGRVTLWAASASAIAVGVVGTGAYGVWFNHDQRGYVEAMASSQHAPEITAPAAAPMTQTALPAQVTVSPAPVARATSVVSVEPAPPAAPVPSKAEAAPAVYSVAPQQASTRPLQVNHHATQNRRPSTPQIKPNPFVRVSLFFQRLSYQQHGTTSQRDRDSDSHR